MGYFVDGEYIESQFYSLEESEAFDDDYRQYKMEATSNDDIVMSKEQFEARKASRGVEMFDPESGQSLGYSGENAKANSEAWRLEEVRKLKEKEKAKEAEAKFKTTEGQGIKRQASLSFGNQTAMKQQSSSQLSQRATGRFDTNRLTL